jgi:hypothetical protein
LLLLVEVGVMAATTCGLLVAAVELVDFVLEHLCL